MYIMTQDERRLVNSDYVSQFYIEKTPEVAKIIADTTDMNILLGTYDNVGHAENVLEFIVICMVDKDRQSKITQVPAQEDMAMSGKLFSKDSKYSGLKKLLTHAMSSDDSEFDLESLLKDILN